MSRSTMAVLTLKNKSHWSMNLSMKYLALILPFLLSLSNVNAFTPVSFKNLQSLNHVSTIQTTLVKKPNIPIHSSYNSRKQSFTIVKSSSSLSSSSSSNNESKGNKKALLSTLSLISIDILLRKAFKKASISFPSSLAGCGVLFATLLILDFVKPDSDLYNSLSPGADVLAKWLPVFFVPSLVTLPLAPSLGSAMELAKVSFVIIAGFYFTLLSTAWSVMGIRKIGKSDSLEVIDAVIIKENDTPTTKPAKKFSDNTYETLLKCTGISFVLATFVSRVLGVVELTTFQSLAMIFTTLTSFVFGARLPAKFTKIVHPLVICTSFTWIGAKIMSLFVGGSSSFLSMLQSYKTGSLSPFHLTGAGDVLLFMLGPAVVSLACQMYNRKTLMRQNLKEVATAVVGSSIGGLFGTALLVRLMNISNPILRLSTLSRNITSPLAMAIASILQADVSLAVVMVVISGLIGANFGAMILDGFGIKDPVARGLGVGAASHGLGTAAFANEKDAFPFAAIAMALTASFSTVLVSIPMVKKALMTLALGA